MATILDSSAALYSSCSAYSDSGRVTVERTNGRPSYVWFATVFERPVRFWMRFVREVPGRPRESWADRTISRLGTADLACCTGLSMGAASAIPRLLDPSLDEVWSVLELEAPQIGQREVGDEHLFIVAGANPISRTTYRVSIDPEGMIRTISHEATTGSTITIEYQTPRTRLEGMFDDEVRVLNDQLERYVALHLAGLSS